MSCLKYRELFANIKNNLQSIFQISVFGSHWSKKHRGLREGVVLNFAQDKKKGQVNWVNSVPKNIQVNIESSLYDIV